MRTTRLLVVAVLTAVLHAADAAAQTPKPAEAAPVHPATAASGATAAPSAPPPTPDSYTYEPAGRRDPFLTLLGTGGRETQASSKGGDGPAGMAVADISVRGVMQSRGELVAMVMGPNAKTYVIHPGDKLLDGTIKAINTQGLVIMQEVNDPLSLVKQREVRKLLRGLEDAK
jgi:Tfp pilus assembly protein PilP